MTTATKRYSDDGVRLYDTEADAQVRAAELTARWEAADGDDGMNAVPQYSVSRGGWIVVHRKYIPGTCT